MVSIVRGQIADPHLANKAKEGRPEDIRPCHLLQPALPRPRACAATGSPASPTPRSHASRSGTAIPRRGLQSRAMCWWSAAARLASKWRASPRRGHRVTLVEEDRPSSAASSALAAGQPERGEIGALLHWYRGQLSKLQVQVKLRTEMSAADISGGRRRRGASSAPVPTRRAMASSAASPISPSLPGAEQDNVCTAHDVLEGKGDAGHARAAARRHQRLVAGQRHRLASGAAAPSGHGRDGGREGRRRPRPQHAPARPLRERFAKIRRRGAAGDRASRHGRARPPS